MKYYRVNRVHKNSIIEEVLRLTIEAENSDIARAILLNNGYKEDEILSIDDDFEIIRVCFDE